MHQLVIQLQLMRMSQETYIKLSIIILSMHLHLSCVINNTFRYLCSSNNISWDGDNNPTIVVKDFRGHHKPYGPIFPTPSILETFLLFFTHNLLEMIVTETNRYASLCLKEKYNDWEKITVDELKAYFGFMILTGIARLPSIRDYWRNDEAFHYHPIANRISRTRFLQIHRFLHFVDNDTLPAYGDTR